VAVPPGLRDLTDKLVNTGVDILPTMLDFAGLEIPKKLPGRSLLALALGKPAPAWRDYVVVEDDMGQAGEVDGLKPAMQGRMVRTERYKYCVYSCGNRRESLVDLQADPGEMNDLAADPAYRRILLEHRGLLRKFAAETRDTLAEEMLAADVAPRPFLPGGRGEEGTPRQRQRERPPSLLV
jgi:arylsulfatase A-like enzyme